MVSSYLVEDRKWVHGRDGDSPVKSVASQVKCVIRAIFIIVEAEEACVRARNLTASSTGGTFTEADKRQ